MRPFLGIFKHCDNWRIIWYSTILSYLFRILNLIKKTLKFWLPNGKSSVWPKCHDWIFFKVQFQQEIGTFGDEMDYSKSCLGIQTYLCRGLGRKYAKYHIISFSQFGATTIWISWVLVQFVSSRMTKNEISRLGMQT